MSSSDMMSSARNAEAFCRIKHRASTRVGLLHHLNGNKMVIEQGRLVECAQNCLLKPGKSKECKINSGNDGKHNFVGRLRRWNCLWTHTHFPISPYHLPCHARSQLHGFALTRAGPQQRGHRSANGFGLRRAPGPQPAPQPRAPTSDASKCKGLPLHPGHCCHMDALPPAKDPSGGCAAEIWTSGPQAHLTLRSGCFAPTHSPTWTPQRVPP